MKIIKKFDEFILEKKKMNAGLQAYLDKKAGKKSDKDDKDEKDEKDEKEEKSGKDGDDDDKDEKECKTKGLTDKQKKLPKALQDAILKRMKK